MNRLITPGEMKQDVLVAANRAADECGLSPLWRTELKRRALEWLGLTPSRTGFKRTQERCDGCGQWAKWDVYKQEWRCSRCQTSWVYSGSDPRG